MSKVVMIGRDSRRRAFAAFIAAISALLALVLVLGAAWAGVLVLKRGGSGDSGSNDDAGAAVIRNDGVKLYVPERDGEVIRLHIVSNSDSEEDQRVKLLVRDEVLALARLKDDIIYPESIAFAEHLLKMNGQIILQAVRRVLEREGMEYDAQLLIGDFEFPDREYAGMLYPAGSYRALRILLGKAEGKNWWCILFPPLCIINAEAWNGASTAGENASGEPGGAQGALTVRDNRVHFESLLVRLFNIIFCGDGER